MPPGPGIRLVDPVVLRGRADDVQKIALEPQGLQILGLFRGTT